jgi:hypothetical protein
MLPVDLYMDKGKGSYAFFEPKHKFIPRIQFHIKKVCSPATESAANITGAQFI